MIWTCTTDNVTGSFIDDVTAETRSEMNSEVYRAKPSTDIQPNAGNLIEWHFRLEMDNNP